jgi:hypothetical protein
MPGNPLGFPREGCGPGRDTREGRPSYRPAVPGAFVDTVDWDILHVCMEAEYADVYPPGFFASQAFWYVQGHFPCGWEGEFPAGRLVLY